MLLSHIKNIESILSPCKSLLCEFCPENPHFIFRVSHETKYRETTIKLRVIMVTLIKSKNTLNQVLKNDIHKPRTFTSLQFHLRYVPFYDECTFCAVLYMLYRYAGSAFKEFKSAVCHFNHRQLGHNFFHTGHTCQRKCAFLE